MKKLKWITAIILFILLVIEFYFVHSKHAHGFHALKGIYACLGILGGFAFIPAIKMFARLFLYQKEDYYRSKE